LAAHIDALIADETCGRDERFAGQGNAKPRFDPIHDKGGKPKKLVRYQPKDFDYDHKGTCTARRENNSMATAAAARSTAMRR
jgi:hypothetical protein